MSWPCHAYPTMFGKFAGEFTRVAVHPSVIEATVLLYRFVGDATGALAQSNLFRRPREIHKDVRYK